MTPLNTIIEEETEFLFSGENEVARFKHQGIGNCTKENITTAMQRAYEAGRISWLRSEIEKLEGEKKGLVTLNCYGNCNPRCHDSGKDILLTSIITWYKKELSGSQE